MNKALLLLAALAALPAAAQDRAAEIDWENARDAVRKAHVMNALTALNDGGSDNQGPKVYEEMTKRGMSVVMADRQAEPSRTDGAVIKISGSEDQGARAIAPLVALEVSKRMFEDMPPCAERAYMRRAVVGAVFVELGGGPGAPPTSAVRAAMGAWYQANAESAYEEIGRAEKAPTLAELRAQGVLTDADAGALEKRFTAFLLLESQMGVRASLGLSRAARP